MYYRLVVYCLLYVFRRPSVEPTQDFFYLSDLIGPDCPPAVRSYLTKIVHLDTIPVFTNNKSRHIAQFADAGRQHFVERHKGEYYHFTYIRSNFTNNMHERSTLLNTARLLALPAATDSEDNPDKRELNQCKVKVILYSF